MRCVRTTIDAVEKQNVLNIVCVCSFNYPACNAYAPRHLRPTPLYNFFSTFLINGSISGKRIIELTVYVLIFSTTFVWNVCHSKNNSATYHKCAQVFIWVPVRLVRFYESPSSGSRVVPRGRVAINEYHWATVVAQWYSFIARQI